MKSTCAARALLVSTLMGLSQLMTSQCVVINEVLINASGECDGNCVPNTAEWLELYNTCDSPVNIGCYVITDGDFSITFPSGTTILPNGYLVVGSSNSVAVVDVDWSSCNCTSGPNGEVGIFTNGNEQIALANASGQIIDGIYWGNGQFSQTPSFTTDPLFGCASQTIQLSASNSVFSQVPAASDGATVYRSCADAALWLADGANYSPGDANGDSSGENFTISASNEAPCDGDTVVLSVSAIGSDFVWSTGATSSSITVWESGVYSASALPIAGCGALASIAIAFQPSPTVDAGPGGLSDCEDGIQLQGSTSANDYYWEPSTGLSDALDLSPIANPTVTTNYTLHAISGNCQATSMVTVIPDCGNLKVPNVFTPNGDGINDSFQPEGKGVSQYSLRVFNRWGSLIFESKQMAKGWNGKIDNDPAPAGTYYFLLMAKDASGRSLLEVDVYAGEVSLLR